MDIYSIFNGGNVKPQVFEKNMLRQYLNLTGRIHRFQIKTNIDTGSVQYIRTIQQFDQYVQTKNIFAELFENLDLEEREWYNCELIAGNDAWISKDENSIYRYFSKTRFGGTVGLNIFDIIEILYFQENGHTFQDVRNKLAGLLGIEELRDEWKIQQYEKYKNNLEFIRGGRRDLEQAFPELNQFIQKYRSILEYMNGHQEEGLFRRFSHQGEHVFFTASNHLKEKLAISQSTVTRSINMLTLIGLIIKIPHHKLPSRLLEISDNIMSYRFDKGYLGGKRITFYQVPLYNEDLLEAAEAVVNKLQAAGVWGSLITKDKVIKLFGEVRAKEVFLAEYIAKKVDVSNNDSDTQQANLEMPDDDDPIPF